MAEWNGDNFPNATPGSSFVGVGGGRGEGRPPGMNWSMGSMYPDRTPLEDDVWFKAFAIVSYSLVFIVSVFGNLLVIVVILCHKQMRSAVNFFLGNLAIADLCVGIFCVLPALFKYLSQYWWLGRVICKMHNFVQCVNYTCSIIILTVISIERYVIISHPLWNKCFSGGWRIRSTVVSVVWLASITYNIPILFSFDLRAALAGNETHYFCARSNNLIRYETYAMVDLTLLYALPLLLMTVVYVRISIILWRSSKLNVRTYSISEEVVGVPPQGGKTSAARGRWCSSKSPLMWCSRGCRGSVVERGQSPWQESIALKVEGQGEGPVVKKMTDTSLGGGGGGVGTTVFNQLKDGLHHEWTIELPMHQMEPVAMETTKRHPTDDLTLSASASSSSSSKATPPAAATTKASPPAAVYQPYQLRRLRNLQQPHPPPLSASNQTTRHQQHPHQQQARPILTTVLNNGRLKHSVVLTTTTTTTTSSGSDCRTPSKVPLALLRRRRVIRLLIAIIVSFAVCTLPNHVRVQYYIWATRPSISYGQFYVPPITMLMFYMNSAINPILYAFISRKFRRAIATIDWRYCWRRLVRGESTSSARYTLN